jgi:FkbM family methyltransferase
MHIVDSFGNTIDISQIEKPEQDLANNYIEKNDVVLELGARYGSVSCVINSKLENKTHQVVVEPDERVWEALEQNKKFNDCHFSIVKGFVSKSKLGLNHLDRDYGVISVKDDETKIPSFTLDEIMSTHQLNFNVLVADCEGFLELFFDENPTFYEQLRLIIFEADYPEKCNYEKIKLALTKHQFKKVLEGHQNVWIRS